MHLTLRSVAFYDGGHAVVTDSMPGDPEHVEGAARDAVSRFEARITGLRVSYTVARLEGVVVYRRDAFSPTGRWDFTDALRRPS